jgi:hypothetical protein
MTKALAGAANASPEMREALKRMYGAKRVGAAATSSTTYKSADAARSAATRTSMSSKPATRTSKVNPMAGAGRAGGVMGGASSAKKTATKPATNSRYAAVAAINAKRMGITVAEYNKRAAALAAKAKKK